MRMGSDRESKQNPMFSPRTARLCPLVLIAVSSPTMKVKMKRSSSVVMASRGECGRRRDSRGRPDVSSVRSQHAALNFELTFIVRPHFTKPDPVPQQPPDEESEDEAAVTETQQADPGNAASDDEFPEDESDYASDDSHSRKKRKTQEKDVKEASTSLAKDGKKAEEGPVKTAARKIKATAHANYRRLKIKSKGGNGGKGRFGRKR